MKSGRYKILLVGNPNSGKTTIFNALSGLKGHVGNYSGVTVDKKTGTFTVGNLIIDIEDLPGVYTLSASTAEERIARDAISSGDFDLVVNVVDSSNFERNLFLTMQLAEIKLPMIVALNMGDELEKSGKYIDEKSLSAAHGSPVITTTAHNSDSIERLKTFIAQNIRSCTLPHFPWHSIGENILTKKIEQISKILSSALPNAYKDYSDLMAVRILENDGLVLQTIKDKTPHVYDATREIATSIEIETGESSETLIAATRYRIIDTICMPSLKTRSPASLNLTRILDSIFLNRFIGIPLFFTLMYAVFEFVFALGDPIMSAMEMLFANFGDIVAKFLGEGNGFLKDLLVDGIIGGVGGVFVFLPNIILLFLALSILEDSGYMARAAFLCDKVMKRFGLSGSSVIPMLIGFGCSVPAIMATRALKSNFERIATIMVIPLFSCGARFPVYMLLIPAFFAPQYCSIAMFTIYIIGIIAAMLVARLLRSTTLRGEDSAFLIELPPYRIPRLRNVASEVWTRSYGFIKKAGTVILAMSIILWALSNFPEKKNYNCDYSAAIQKINATQSMSAEAKATAITELENIKLSEKFDYTAMGRIGGFLEPVFRPLGYDNKIVSALLASLAAKEVFISQMGIIYGSGSDGEAESTLREKIATDYSQTQGISILLFVLLTAPCLATIATTYTETRSWKVAAGQFFGLMTLAYFVAMSFYQISKFVL